jgi:2-keto-4-pentenoate hydratase/2-oxohepta-3-ene-1,7-dioic acid hydratase in catechol pathway
VPDKISYVRFQRGDATAYGVLEGDTVHPIQGGLLENSPRTGASYPISEVKLLFPCEPTKILAVGLNYKSHLRGRPQPSHPEIFYKPPSALLSPGEAIVIPQTATNVHFEGELVIVVGRRAKHASEQEAREAIFGVTCGNDVSEREWQGGPQKDLQWWRAKGSDTFAPLGPVIVRGIEYGKLLLQTRVNGQTLQEQYTSDLIFDCPAIVQWVSQWVTLNPGDLIYTGTPGSTQKMNPGDVVEVEIEGIGVLRNPVAAA